MGKGRKEQQYPQYDEASSGSDDDHDSSDDDDEDRGSHHRRRQGERTDGKINNSKMGEETNESDTDDDGDDSGNEAEQSPSNNNRDDDDDNNNLDSDDDDDDDDDNDNNQDHSNDEEDVPLHERLLKKEGRGRRLQTSHRERKSRAIEEATKRLATFKETQRKNNKKRKADDDDDDVETTSNSKKSTATMTKNTTTTTKKKKNKNKPTEVSSKRADFFGRGARRLNESGLGVDIGAHRYKPMDPRASNLSGHFDEDRFENNYEFLEEMRNKEIGQVRKRIAAHKATGNKGNRMRRKQQITQADGSHSSTLEDDVARLKGLTETRANLERRKVDRAAKQSVKRKIREDVESGKSGAYFLKRKEKKRLELGARFEEIRKRGGEKAVEKVLAKKRQKNKSRDASTFAK